MTLQEQLAIAQFVVMAAAGIFAWWTARSNRQYERDRADLIARIDRLEARFWDDLSRRNEPER